METNPNSIPTPPQSSMPQPPPSQPSANTGMAILAYIGILVIIPLVTSKEDPFVKYHIKQGLALLIVWIIATVLWSIPVLGWFVAPVVHIACFILMILGIINAANGQMKELPVIGSFGHSFKF